MLWETELTKVAERVPPEWGFASSPLVVEDLVVVYAGGANGKGTLAFRTDSGELAWSAPAGDQSYSSPQLATLLGEDALLMLTNEGLDLLDPKSGAVWFHYEWRYRGYRALQPQRIGDDVLLPTGAGAGTRRIRLSKSDSTWSAAELWTSRRLSADFNDFVVHDGHAFGFDGTIFTCVDLETGERRWKQGRYGAGQVVSLASSDLLLVAAESGEVFLLDADPSEHRELGVFQALEGKTWNHPVVVGDRLYVRNAQHAACYRLP